MTECGIGYIASTKDVTSILSSLRLNEIYTLIFDYDKDIIHIIWIPEFRTFKELIHNLDTVESIFEYNRINVEPDRIVFVKVIERDNEGNVYSEYGPNAFDILSHEWDMRSLDAFSYKYH